LGSGEHETDILITGMEKTFSYEALLRLTREVFRSIGCTDADAELAATGLLRADLRGIDSHGVARLTGYVRLWEAGRANSRPQISIPHETPSTGVVDGDRGLGLVVAPFAMDLAIRKAKAAGSGWIAVRNSNHFGIAAQHALKALEEDMIGIVMTNASALVAPTFSIERMLGTNPVCVAIPSGKEPPFVADLATTTAANGKLEILQRRNELAPAGWIQDKEGRISTNPHELKAGGALLPLGGDREHGSHKGYALGAVVDIFSGVLSGANYGPWVPPFPAYVPIPINMPGKGIGHFFGAMRIDGFRKAEDFKKDMDQWLKRFRSARPASGHERVMVPGDPEREIEAIRREKGIPLMRAVLEDLNWLAGRFGILPLE
jgi:LDH2 family malate/lactate/ureidoglycolate dehydrogenase